jgi:hypothetical protein
MNIETYLKEEGPEGVDWPVANCKSGSEPKGFNKR